MRETVLLKFNGMDYSVWKKEFEKIKPCNLETITEYGKENKREGLTESNMDVIYNKE
jgi:hypothetical protein